MSAKVAIRPPERSHLLQYVLHISFPSSPLWMLSIHLGPRTLTNALRASPFRETSRNPPTGQSSHLPLKDNLLPKTGNLLHSNIIPAAEDNLEDRALPEKIKKKRLSSPIPSTKREGWQTKPTEIGWTCFLVGGGRWFSLDRTFPAISGNFSNNLTKNSDCLLRRRTNIPSLSAGVTQQQQALRPSSSCEEALGLSDDRRGGEYVVSRILQSSFPGSQTRWNLQANHRSQEVKYLSGHSFFQNGNSFLHHRSSPTTRMDYQDRPQRCLSSYPGSCVHSQIL